MLRLLIVMLVALSGAEAAAPSLGGGEPVDVPVGRLFAGIVLSVLAAFAAAAVMARKGGRKIRLTLPQFGGAQTPARLLVKESRRISPQSELCLFECDDREYLVLISEGGPLVLREKPAGEGSA